MALIVDGYPAPVGAIVGINTIVQGEAFRREGRDYVAGIDLADSAIHAISVQAPFELLTNLGSRSESVEKIPTPKFGPA